MYIDHADMLTEYALSLLHGYVIPLFHVLVSPSHRHSNTLNTICHVNTHYIRYRYFMLFHVHLWLCNTATCTLIHEYSIIPDTLSPLLTHRYTGYSIACKYLEHYTGHILICSWALIHGYSTMSFHVPVSPSHRHSNTLSTIDYIIICYIIYHYFMLFHVHLSLLHGYWASRHDYSMFVNHWYTDMLLHWILLHGYDVHSYFMFLLHYNTDSLVYMYWLSMYSCCIDHGL